MLLTLVHGRLSLACKVNTCREVSLNGNAYTNNNVGAAYAAEVQHVVELLMARLRDADIRIWMQGSEAA